MAVPPIWRHVEIRPKASRLVRLRVQSEETCHNHDDDHDADDVENVHGWTPIEAGGFNTKSPRFNSERLGVNASSTVR
jgi:hypothetical protein